MKTLQTKQSDYPKAIKNWIQIKTVVVVKMVLLVVSVVAAVV
jgi:hypothetical protein